MDISLSFDTGQEIGDTGWSREDLAARDRLKVELKQKIEQCLPAENPKLKTENEKHQANLQKLKQDFDLWYRTTHDDRLLTQVDDAFVSQAELGAVTDIIVEAIPSYVRTHGTFKITDEDTGITQTRAWALGLFDRVFGPFNEEGLYRMFRFFNNIRNALVTLRKRIVLLHTKFASDEKRRHETTVESLKNEAIEELKELKKMLELQEENVPGLEDALRQHARRILHLHVPLPTQDPLPSYESYEQYVERAEHQESKQLEEEAKLQEQLRLYEEEEVRDIRHRITDTKHNPFSSEDPSSTLVVNAVYPFL